MGIQGLIPFLEKASRPINISEFSGTTVAVDAYCWLHKGAFSCAEKLARGEKCDANREINRRRAAELLRMDKPDQAKVYIRRCVDITHNMAVELMHACREHNVDCITAPFEADAQLAYLNLTGIAHLVITEDSDLVLFGCKKVIFKMDLNGGGLLIDQDLLHLPMKVRKENFSFDKLRRMCILSGCDYLPSLPGIGLSKACRFITKTADPDIHRALTRMGSYLNMALVVTQEYRDNFIHAEAMFKHQPVFDPIKSKVVPLTPIEPNSPPLKLPTPLPDDQAYQLALGNLDPFTLKTVCNWNPDNGPTKSKTWKRLWCNHPSIWSADFKPTLPPPPRNIKAQRPPSTAGKQCIKKTDSILPVAPSVVDDSRLEEILMECDEPDCPPNKKARLQEDGMMIVEESETNFSNNGHLSPELSNKNKQNVPITNRFKRKRNTTIDDNCTVFSRYFNSPNTSEELKCETKNATCDNILNEEKEKDTKLRDLSNKLRDKVETEIKFSPKKNCTNDDIENIVLELPESLLNNSTDLVNNDDENNLSFTSSQNSLGSETASNSSNSQTLSKSNSLFKWKKQFYEKFGYLKAKLLGPKSVNSDFQIPGKLSRNITDKDDITFKAEEKNCVDDNEKCLLEISDSASVSSLEPPSVEKKKVCNPFKMNSVETKISPCFSLLRDPVPDAYSQEFDESFINKPSPVKMKTSPASDQFQKKSSSTKTSSRSVGLSKKPMPGKSAQKSLLSVFMLQPKPKIQC
ncbi:exonuclease tos isoform X2 [Lycorma delicatula]|uniref:exonuclease tos isoform X2 n=1 Tax=Lycorma delicatula TaxID=130591 RepID=UPI003F51257F